MSVSTSLFSFFSGAGFLDLGFELNGFPVDFVNEVHKPFVDAYQYSRSNLGLPEPRFGIFQTSVEDFSQGSGRRLLADLVQQARRTADVVGFIGGPPCPDFSVGGKNRGRHGDNGRLSAVYIDLICDQQPDFFLFENVKGLWSTKKHRAFYEELKHRVHAAGYVTTERLMNAIEYGAPQDRDRIILFGFHRSLLTAFGVHLDSGLEMPADLFPWRRYTQGRREQIFGLPWPTTSTFVEDSFLPCPDGIRVDLTVQYWFEKNDVENHPNSVHYFKPRNGKARFETIDEGDVSKKSFKRLHRWRYSPTVAYGNNEVHLHPYRARRLTVAEALALQSLPKGFVLPPTLSLTDMFKTIGNGVPFLMAAGLAKSLWGFLRGETDEAHCCEHRELYRAVAQG